MLLVSLIKRGVLLLSSLLFLPTYFSFSDRTEEPKQARFATVSANAEDREVPLSSFVVKDDIPAAGGFAEEFI